MAPRQARRWHSWEDYMVEWCGRPEFRADLPRLLHGEDPEFVTYLSRLAEPKDPSTQMNTDEHRWNRG
jgi:hypothetical protein